MVDKLKVRLKITWDEEDLTLRDILDQGKYYLDTITAHKLDYETNRLAESLLLEYCRYSYNNVLELFEDNFKHQLMKLQFEVALYEES